MHFTRTLAAFALFSAGVAAPAWAGPPLICHAIPIGSQHSLPWIDTGTWNGADLTYDVSQLEQDTLALLGPSAPVDVRMETLRRAAIYSARRDGLADALSVALMGRVMDAQAGGTLNPSAWFDAGYFAETLRQAAEVYPMLRGSEHNAWTIHSDTQHVDGLSWMRMAVRLGGGNKMQSAIAIVERETQNR